MKEEIKARGTILNAAKIPLDVEVRGFLFSSPQTEIEPAYAWVEIDEKRDVKMFFKSGGCVWKPALNFDHTARQNMLELLETEGAPVHQLD